MISHCSRFSRTSVRSVIPSGVCGAEESRQMGACIKVAHGIFRKVREAAMSRCSASVLGREEVTTPRLGVSRLLPLWVDRTPHYSSAHRFPRFLGSADSARNDGLAHWD